MGRRARHAGGAQRGAVAGALIAGGAAGNLVDRAVRGHVIDFVHLHGWPVFNVTDIALVAGGVLLVAAAFVAKRRGSPATASPPLPLFAPHGRL